MGNQQLRDLVQTRADGFIGRSEYRRKRTELIDSLVGVTVTDRSDDDSHTQPGFRPKAPHVDTASTTSASKFIPSLSRKHTLGLTGAVVALLVVVLATVMMPETPVDDPGEKRVAETGSSEPETSTAVDRMAVAGIDEILASVKTSENWDMAQFDHFWQQWQALAQREKQALKKAPELQSLQQTLERRLEEAQHQEQDDSHENADFLVQIAGALGFHKLQQKFANRSTATDSTSVAQTTINEDQDVKVGSVEDAATKPHVAEQQAESESSKIASEPVLEAVAPARAAADAGRSTESGAKAGVAKKSKSTKDDNLAISESAVTGSNLLPGTQTRANSALTKKSPAADATPPALAASINHADLEAMIASFVQAFQKGDVEQVVALFDSNARYLKVGTTAEIRGLLARSFDQSFQRSVTINKLNWQLQDNTARGAGQYKSVINSKLNGEIEKVIADLDIEILKKDNRMFITNFQISHQQISRSWPDKIKPAPVQTNAITGDAELNNFIDKFAQIYQEGNVDHFMALFAQNARTGDRVNRDEIKSDYQELFSTTASRKISINNIHWKISDQNANGDGEFVVTVKNMNDKTENIFRGKIAIELVKTAQGLQITQLVHEEQ